jgi:molybdopterin-dependent oxidoreductase alpha subunit
MSKRKIHSAEPPQEFENLKVGKVQDVAAGLPALKKSIEHIQEAMPLSRGIKALSKLNQHGGFDCPGCAWPDPDVKRTFLAEYCENGVKAIAEEATTKKADADFFKSHAIEDLLDKSDYWFSKQGRLTQPMFLAKGAAHYRPISWDEALTKVAGALKETSPDRSVFYTSGRTSNEAAFLYQLLVRKYGTNNLPDCSNMCHESSGAGLSQTLGIGKGSVTLEDIHQADLIMVMGQNPGTNHPRMLKALQKNKANGGKIITVNPLPEAGLMNFKDPQNLINWVQEVKLTDLFIPVRVNGDVAFLKALMYKLLEAHKKDGGVIDEAFIAEKCMGYEHFIKDLEAQDYNELVHESGVDWELIEQAAQLIIHRKNMIICWAMGLTQHKNGVGNIQEVVNLLLMRGSIGKPGAGTCPVRGHSNVQGDRTMGIWEKPKDAFLDSLQSTFHFNPPREHGYDTVEAIEAMLEGKVDVFFAMGGNFISATPDTKATSEGMQKCKLTVHVSTKPNRSHCIAGEEALILPCLGRSEKDVQGGTEQFITVENSMGVVHSSQGNLNAISEHLKSEPEIICDLAEKLFGAEDNVAWSDFKSNYDLIRNKIEAVIPGFENYNARVRKKGGFYLPNKVRNGDFSDAPHGKAQFTVNPTPKSDLKQGELVMMTIRSHDQYNTTIYGLDDRYRGIYNERRVVLMNEGDMEARGLKNQEVVHLQSHFKGEKREARLFKVIPFPVPKGCCATYFPEANVLVPLKSKADKSNTPTSKFVVVTIHKASEGIS